MRNRKYFSTALGTSEVMGASAGQGCVPAADRLDMFRDTSDESESVPAWDTLSWGKLQDDCAQRHHKSRSILGRRFPLSRAHVNIDNAQSDVRIGRSAVVLRLWDTFTYTTEFTTWLRAITTELALDTGGRFQPFILIEVKEKDVDLTDVTEYDRVLADIVPAEFRDMALLFNQDLLKAWFPKVKEYSPQHQMYQPIEIFSQGFSEFDHVWQLEADARFTGNIADMLTGAANWAEQQPRKNLWERNARFYISGLWKDYDDFARHVDIQVEDQGVWGPPLDAQQHVAAQIYTTAPAAQDNEWGIGEAADLITFSPIIDVAGTDWIFEDLVCNFTKPKTMPRRMSIVSMTRTSRRLLRLIHDEQIATGAWVVTESTTETFSFLHGLKAVYVPHLVSISKRTSPLKLDRMLHKGPVSNLAGGWHSSLVWTHDNTLSEPRWYKSTYFYRLCLAGKAWMDYLEGSCLEPMLLHPVKL